MNLKDILVEEVKFSDYYEAMQRVGVKRKFKHYMKYGEIATTLHFDSHRHALDEFLRTEHAARISLNNKGRWQKHDAGELRNKHLFRYATHILDSDEFKSNYFELLFMGRDSNFPLVLRFTTLDSGLYVTELEVPKLDLGMISSNMNLNERFAKVDATLFRTSRYSANKPAERHRDYSKASR